MPRIARAIRARLRSITERRLRKRLLSFLGIAIIALCHRVAHDNDFARIASRARLSRLRVANANLGTRSRRTRWQRRIARKFGFPDLAIRHGHGRFRWTIRVRHNGMRKTLAERGGRRMAQRLAAEKKELHAWKHAFGKRRVDQAQISERGGRNPYRHVRFRQIGEQRARVSRELMGNGMHAAARRKRADQFVFGKVERIRRLVEKHLAALANYRKRAHPLHEIAHIVRRNLDTFRLACRARREDDILRFLAAHPCIARRGAAARKRVDKRGGVRKAGYIEHAIGGDIGSQRPRQRRSAHDEGRIKLG